jgi:hypothetical protein
MAITPINPFTADTRTRVADAAAAAVQPFAATAAATNVAATSVAATGATTLGGFSAVLGQLLANLGPLALDTTLTTAGTGTTNGGGSVAGLTNTVFDLLLLSQLGLGQNATQPTVQQLLVAQLLLSSTNSGSDTLGLGTLVAEQLASALVQQGAGANLVAQTNAASTQPNPIVFSSSVVAQAFQIGNDTGTPA